MQSDLPHTLFNRAKNGGGGKEGGTTVTDDVVKRQMEANARAIARRKELEKAKAEGKDPEVTLDELFSGQLEQ